MNKELARMKAKLQADFDGAVYMKVTAELLKQKNTQAQG